MAAPASACMDKGFRAPPVSESQTCFLNLCMKKHCALRSHRPDFGCVGSHHWLLARLAKAKEVGAVPSHTTPSPASSIPTTDWTHRAPGSLPWKPSLHPGKTVMLRQCAHASDPSAWKTTAGRWWVPDKHGLHSETLSQRRKHPMNE